jgi:hypothetical protein
MKLRKEKVLLNILLGTGLYLLDSVRDRLSDGAGDFSERARDRFDDLRQRTRDSYDTVSDRVSRATDVMRGEDRRVLNTTVAVLAGAGIGVALGLVFAPASGEETRSNIADKVREGFSRMKEPATGTYGT